MVKQTQFKEKKNGKANPIDYKLQQTHGFSKKKKKKTNKQTKTQYTKIRNQRTTTTNGWRSGLKLELQNGRTHRIRDQSSSPQRVANSTTPQPQASLLSQPQSISSLHLTSLFFSLTNMGYWIWVNGFLSISVSLSLFEE